MNLNFLFFDIYFYTFTMYLFYFIEENENLMFIGVDLLQLINFMTSQQFVFQILLSLKILCLIH